MIPLRRRNAGLALLLAAFAATIMLLLRAETPRGSFSGLIKTAESGAALPGVRVTIVSHPAGENSYRARTDSEGRFAFRNVAAGQYRLMAETRAHHQPEDIVDVREGRTASAIYELKPMDPFLRIFDNQQVFTTQETPRLRLQGFVPANSLTVQTYALEPEAAIRSWRGWLPGALRSEGRDLTKVDLNQVAGLVAARSFTVPVTRRDVEGVFREDISMPGLGPGMYLAAIQGGKVRTLSVVTVTDLSIIVKSSPRETLVWAVRMDTGVSVPGAEIRLMKEGNRLISGTTGPDGLAQFDTASLAGGNLEVVGEYDGSLAMASIWRNEDPSEGRLRVYTYTDRPVYRPGHTVHFKSMARELTGDNYVLPGADRATVQVTDGMDNLVYRAERPINGFGSLSGDFTLSESAIPGMYTITVEMQGTRNEQTFSVAEYRKPEFEVKVALDQERYTRGDTMTADIDARYFYGAPVPNGRVEWYVTRSMEWYWDASDPWNEDLEEAAAGLEYGDYGEGEIVREGRGLLDDNGRLRIMVPPAEDPADARRLAWGNDWRYTVHAIVTDDSERSENGKTSALMTQGAFRLSVEVDDGVAEPGVPVQVTVKALDYEGKPVAGVTGEAVMALAHWENREERLDVQSQSNWQADGNGEATLEVTPRETGDYRVTVTAKDTRGNTIRSSTGIWVMDEPYASFPYPYEDMEVKADKRLYREGETAEIIVNTRHAPQTVLMSLEGAGIVEHRFVKLIAKTTVVQVPITPDMMPAVRAHFCFFRNKQFISGESLLNVSRERKALKVEISSDKEKYLPGETATYSVRTLGPDGKPVAAEVSLGLVDKAIYAIRPESVQGIVPFFYPKRLYEVQTAFSFPQVYMSGDDKAGALIETRRRFEDTAYWDPSTITDNSGRASFTVQLPDNLTTWRATCRAATQDTRVGQSTQEVVVNKPFLVRLEAPRFFTQGDAVTVAAVAHNLTDQTLTADLGIETSGLKIEGKPGRKERIHPGETRRVEWTATAETIGHTKVRVWGQAGQRNDAMELTLPVLARGRSKTDVQSGALTDRELAGFDVRQDAVPGTPTLTVRLSPSLAGAMLGSLEYLASYPYGCVEQTMSSFLPDLVIQRMMNDLGVGNPELRAKLPRMVESGLLKIYDLQGEQGWGWWRYDEPDPWMTAYVMFGLQEARESGYTVSSNSFNRGRSALLAVSSQPKWGSADTRAFTAYVLVRTGERDAALRILREFQDTTRQAKLTRWGRSMQAMALGRAGDASGAQRVLARAWEERAWDGRSENMDTWHSETENSAALLWAAMELAPNDTRIPTLVSRIMKQRRGDYWFSTRDTSFVLLGMSRYLRATDELEPDMETLVLVNGKEIARQRFTREDIFQPEREIVVEAGKLGSGHVEVQVQKTGRGRVYYTATLEQTAAEDLSVPVKSSGGLVVERAYRTVQLPRADRPESGKPGKPRLRFENGKTIEVELTLRADRAMDYVMIEDHLPAGCEVPERGRMERWEWSYWWAEQVVRDEMVGFAVRRLEPGVHHIRYRMVARTPGRFTALPPRVYDMYDPSTRGEGVSDTLTIR